MNCTCKEWINCSDVCRNEGTTPFSFCPWCGSPLLPDPVEKMEWEIESHCKGTFLDCVSTPDEKEANRILNDKAAAYPQSVHTLKSITTIEKTIRIVRPKT